MRRFVSLLLSLCMVLPLCACGPKETASTWQEQYDLGIRYLSEGNYEEAIIAFTAAIKIDSKQPDIYEKLAESYVATGDTEQARKTLEDGYVATGSETLQKQLAELITSLVDGELREYFDENDKLISYTIFYVDPSTGYDRNDSYSSDGILQNYYLYHYSEDGLTQITECYSLAGELQHTSTLVKDENGQVISSKTSNGRETKYVDGGWDNYENGVLISYARFENGVTVYYDANGNITGHN